jgi:hypothetical protein
MLKAKVFIVFNNLSEEISNPLSPKRSVILGIIILIALTNISIYRHIRPIIFYTITTTAAAAITTTTAANAATTTVA